VQSKPLFVITARDRIVSRYHTSAGRREWQALLEEAGLDYRVAWRQYAALACPTLPAPFLAAAIEAARAALKAEAARRVAA
jgi:hypothetical protein